MVSTKRRLEAEVQETWPGNVRSHMLLEEPYKDESRSDAAGCGELSLILRAVRAMKDVYMEFHYFKK
jgi:hypothetical protein